MVFGRLSRSRTKALESRFTTFSEQLQGVFGRIKNDITTTNSKVYSAEKDLNNLKLWVAHLNHQNKLLEGQNKDLTEKLGDLNHFSSKLHTSHTELKDQHSRVQETLKDYQEALKQHK